MERIEVQSGQADTRIVRWRRVSALALLCACALLTLRTEAVYYRGTARGPRSASSLDSRSIDRSKLQPLGDPKIVGESCRDEEGNVIVRWPWGINSAGFWCGEESLALGQFKNEEEFLKVYLEKCEARGKQPDNKRVLGADYERKRVYKAAGRKMWAEHLEVLRAARAKEKQERKNRLEEKE